MIASGIIAPCHPSKVKAVSPTTLAQKAHDTGGLTLDEIRQLINDQLLSAGNPTAFVTPHQPLKPGAANKHEQKWRICQNFAEVNKVTQVTPMPQGDIRAKQQQLSGHRWCLSSILRRDSMHAQLQKNHDHTPHSTSRAEATFGIAKCRLA